MIFPLVIIFGSFSPMKSTKVQNPRRIPRIKPIMCVYWPLPGQLSPQRRLAASVCLVWGKVEPAIRPSRTILHDLLNKCIAKYACALQLNLITEPPNSENLATTKFQACTNLKHHYIVQQKPLTNEPPFTE